MASDGKQICMKLAFGVHRAPTDAPARLVRQVEDDAMAIAICMDAHSLKLAYVGKVIDKSEGYVSRLRSGERPVPDKLIEPLCWALGSNLLKQARALRAYESGCELSRMASMLLEAA